MTTVGEGFWAELDKQVADAVLGGNAVPHGTVTRPHVVPTTALVRNGPEAEPIQMPVASPKWSGVLDIINGARVHAEAQRDQLREQAAAFDQAVREMREDAAAVRQQVLVLEAQHQEAKAELERQLVEISAQAEERVRNIQAQADAQVAQARQATQDVEERAVLAEDWLKRIEEAAASLVLGSEATSFRRAA